MRWVIVAVAVVVLGVGAERAAGAGPATLPAFTAKGLPASPDFFPVAVWLQAPRNAAKFKAAGINLYVALYRGPTEAQLDELEKVGMPVVCEPTEVGLRNKHRKVILGWMHGDEPDNAQSRGPGKGYGPPVLPATIVEGYERIRAADPTRPVLLNLGQGVAWDGWYGRGVRTNHPEDYPLYAKGCDIASFDIYPAAHDHKDVYGKLWFVPQGVDRLRKAVNDEKPVWSCIETTRIGHAERGPTPRDVRAEVWMALVHGARGILYFNHQFKPKFIEAGMLADAEMTAAVTAINEQIRVLAPVLNSPTLPMPGAGGVTSSDAQKAPIDAMFKRHGGATFIFAVGMRDVAATGTFAVAGLKGAARVEVIGEGRTIEARDGRWEDRFEGYGVHLYRVPAAGE